MLAGIIHSTSVSFAEGVDSAQAVADRVNAAGGINGHKVTILSCNDQLDPNIAALCGREAVADHVSAVVEVETNYLPEMLSSLTPAHIPVLGVLPGNPVELTASNVYPLGAGSYATFAGLGTALVNVGQCKRVSIAVNAFKATEISGENIKASVEAAGGTVTNVAAVSPILADYSSVVATALDDNAQCIAAVTGPAQVTALLQSIHSSRNPHLLYGGVVPDPQGFAGLKNEMTGDIFTNVQYSLPVSQTFGPPPSSLSPYLTDMKTYKSSAPIDNQGLQSWEGMQLFVDAARTTTDYSGAGIIAALNKLQNVNVAGLPVPISYDTTNPNPKMSRVTEPYVLVYQVEGGLLHLLPNKVNIQQGLSAFLAKSS